MEGPPPLYHAPARAPEKQDGGKRYTIFCHDTRLSLRQPGTDIPYVNLQNAQTFKHEDARDILDTAA
eukprot:7112137-Lingulodinium_polyedra.AAC.1